MKLDNITKKLEEGVKAVFESEKWKEYLDFMGKFYDYSANNCLLIMMQKPEASLVTGYKSWEKMNRHVKKGEKAIKIIAPMMHKTERINREGETEEVKWTTYHAVSVFDISQTEGEAVPEGCCKRLTSDFSGFSSMIDKLIKVAEIPVKFEEIQGANGYYCGAEECIKIKNDLSESQTIKTLLHEIAHSIMHKKDGEAEKASRNNKEVQAESVAYIVSNYLGLETSEDSFGYIAGWSAGKDTKELLNGMELIKKTSKQIIDRMKGEEK